MSAVPSSNPYESFHALVKPLSLELFIDSTSHLATSISNSAVKILMASTLLMITLRVIYGSITFGFKPPLESIFWGILGSFILRHYSPLFEFSANLFESLYQEISSESNLLDFFYRADDAGGENTKPGSSILWFQKIIAKFMLAPFATGAYLASWISAQFMLILSGTFLAILSILGPIYIAFSPLTSGKSLFIFLKTFLEIGLWRVMPGLFLLVITSIRINYPQSVLGIAVLDICLGLMALLTPIFVRYFLSSGISGMGALGYSLFLIKAMPFLSKMSLPKRSPKNSPEKPPSQETSRALTVRRPQTPVSYQNRDSMWEWIPTHAAIRPLPGKSTRFLPKRNHKEPQDG